jgi:AraC-like DNA-binding protein
MPDRSSPPVAVYEEHGVDAFLRDVAVCTWTRPPSGATQLMVLPDGCVDLVWRSDGWLFVAGPDVRPAVHLHPPDVGFDGIRLRTGVAGTILDCRVDELANQQVDLAAVWGTAADTQGARLDDAESPQERRAVLAAIVRERFRAVEEPDAEVLAATSAIARAGGPIADIADRVGLSERQLHRRMLQQVGYGPKTLDRILRFRRFLRLSDAVRAGTRTLGWAAATAGYADQSHLARECRRLAGSTPSALAHATDAEDV